MNQNPILSSLPSILNSIALQSLGGLGIFYGVYKFFKTIDENLNAEAASAIANWILGSDNGNQSKTWPDTFAIIFGRVFGDHQLSWRCLGSSVLITSVSTVLIAPLVILSRGTAINREIVWFVLPTQILASVVPNYICILLTRTCISVMQRYRSILLSAVLLIVALYLGYLLSGIAMFATAETQKFFGGVNPGSSEPFAGLKRGIDLMTGSFWASMFASLASSIWLWLFVGSALLLKGARSLKFGFNWFNRTFDIRKKPLACLGLVAGATCAVLWWAYLITLHLATGANHK